MRVVGKEQRGREEVNLTLSTVMDVSAMWVVYWYRYKGGIDWVH